MKIEFFDDLDNLVYICIENMLFIECIMLYGFDNMFDINKFKMIL